MADTAKSGGHLLTDEELHRVQSIFLEMAKEVDEVCRRHHRTLRHFLEQHHNSDTSS